jgi:hypothetical protein
MNGKDWRRKQIKAAPEPSNPRLRSMVVNVECTEDEDVEWFWTETADGRFVSGYRIVPRVQERTN